MLSIQGPDVPCDTLVEGTEFQAETLPAKQAKGAVRKAAGKVVGDARLQAEGKADKAEGKLQNAVGGLKNAIRRVEGVSRKSRDAAHQAQCRRFASSAPTSPTQCPLTLVAGLGHWIIGSVDWHIVGALLLGSCEGFKFGSHLAAQQSSALESAT
jgi:uncharacterized protein YjbJ (UPF0337 family)